MKQIIIFLFIIINATLLADTNNYCYEAETLTLPTSSVSTTLNKSNDEYDYYRFNSGTSTSKLRITINSSKNISARLDKYWCGNTLVTQDSGTNIILETMLTADTNYFVTLQTTENGPNSYTISLEVINCLNNKVDDDNVECSDACFTTINEAITNSPSGTKILVCKGIYNEYLTIDKNDLNITSFDNNRSSVIIQNSSNHDLITINGANGFALNSITIKQNDNNKEAIVVNSYSQNIKINDVNITSNSDGIKLSGGNGALEITNSYISDAGGKAIDIDNDLNGGLKIINSHLSSSDDTLEFDTINGGVTIKNSYLVTSSNAIDIKNTQNGNFSILDTNITSSNNAILGNVIYGDFSISNSNITTQAKGIEFGNGEEIKSATIINSHISTTNQSVRFNTIYNSGVTITNSTITSATSYGIQFDNAISGLVNISNSKIFANSRAIYFKEAANSGITISNSEINSTANRAIEFSNDVWGSKTKIDSSKIGGYTEGIYFAGNDIGPIITNSIVSSRTSHGINAVNVDYDKLDMNTSCIYSLSSGSYGLRLRIANTNSHINKNCFYATNSSDLAYSLQSGNDFLGNYWNGVVGNYTLNNISDTTPLSSCPFTCGDSNTTSPTTPAFKFDAYDTTRSLSDRNISTKLVLQDFNLTIAETNSTDFNGTLCATIDKSTWKKLLFSNSHESIASFNHQKALKNAKIYMEWAYNKDLSCPLNINDGNSTYSTDNFAIRPQNFTISSPNDKNASEVFSISFLANSAIDYNETINSSFSIDYNITKAGCNNGVLYIPNASFLDGNLSFDTNFSEIGELNITISEKNATSFSMVDNDDTPDTQRIITKASKLINFTPYELNITDFSYTNTNGKNWLYMDDLLEQNTTVSFKVKAQNKAHESLINFDKNCYAKEVNVSLSFTPDVNLSLLTELNTTKILNDANFTNGTSEQVSYIYNIKREIGKPSNPMDINLSEINTTNPNIINLGLNLDKNSTKYYYGRVHSPDYKIYEAITVDAIYEVYCKSCSDKNSSWISSVDDYYWYKISNDIFDSYPLTKTETIEIPSSKYLRYNIFGEDINNSFFVEFLIPNTTSWNGVGKHVDLNVSQRSNNRIEW